MLTTSLPFKSQCSTALAGGSFMTAVLSVAYGLVDLRGNCIGSCLVCDRQLTEWEGVSTPDPSSPVMYRVALLGLKIAYRQVETNNTLYRVFVPGVCT